MKDDMLSGNKDISRLLKEWAYDPTKVNVRRIIGEDGREKIQLRLDLGILQMEVSGRPDGKRPYGKESLLHHYLDLLENYRARYGSDEGFVLTREDCMNLQQEAIQYYHRYLSLFHLGDFEGVIRDTERNLRVFDLVKKYAEDERDRQAFEQFRPYVIMMQTRARASIALRDKEYDRAIEIIEEGMERIRRVFAENGAEEYMESSPEIAFLTRWIEEIQESRPLDPIEKLRRDLQEAVAKENYELAAKIRDQLKKLEGQNPPPPKEIKI